MPKRKVEGLWCLCQSPIGINVDMLQCEFCEDWFHQKCILMTEEVFKNYKFNNEQWTCCNCVELLRSIPTLSKQAMERLNGKMSPKHGWTTAVVINDFLDKHFLQILVSDKIKVKGYEVFYNKKVWYCSSNVLPPYLYFRSKVHSTHKSDTSYQVTCCYLKSPLQLKWMKCSCLAGVSGECKHSAAMCYYIQSMVRLGVTEFPEEVSPTDVQQAWGVKKAKSDTTSFLSAFKVEKPARGKQKTPLGVNVSEYSKNVNLSLCVTSEKLKNLASVLSFTNFPVLDTWKDCSYTPVLFKVVEENVCTQMLFTGIEASSFEFNVEDTLPRTLLKYDEFYNNIIKVDIPQAKEIENKTRLQSQSQLWKDYRFFRLTASNFKKFVHMKDTTDVIKSHQSSNTSTFSSLATEHGKKYETSAIKLFLEKSEFQNAVSCHSSVGLCINPLLPFLGASPDYLAVIDGVLCLFEVKCPYTLYVSNTSIYDRAKQKDFYCTIDVDGQLAINKQHSVYYQIQGQLNLCNIDCGYLILFVPPRKFEYVKVPIDRNFFNDIIPWLAKRWFDDLLPHFSGIQVSESVFD